MVLTLGLVAIVNLAIGYMLALVIEQHHAVSPTPSAKTHVPESVDERPILPPAVDEDSIVAACPPGDFLAEPRGEMPLADLQVDSPLKNAATVDMILEPVVLAPPVEPQFVEQKSVESFGEPEPIAEVPEDFSFTPVTTDLDTFIASLGEFESDITGHRRDITRLSEQLRDKANVADRNLVDTCIDELKSVNDDYLTKQQGIAASAIVGGIGPEALDRMRMQLENAFRRQTGAIAEINAHLDEVRAVADPIARCERLLLETEQLINADLDLSGAIVEVREEITPAPAALISSPSANATVTDSATIEEALVQCWQNDPQRTRAVAIGQVDIDNLRQLTTNTGTDTANRIAKWVEHLLVENCRRDDLVAPLGRSRFLVLMLDEDASSAAHLFDELRQIIDATEFSHEHHFLRTTVTCGLAAATKDDTVDSLLARMAAAFDDARTGGRNNTVWHDGVRSTVIAPEKLAIESRQVVL